MLGAAESKAPVLLQRILSSHDNGHRHSSAISYTGTLSGLCGFFDSLQLFSGLEAHGFARRNVHLFPGARVAADARLARLNAENPEASQLAALAAAERVLQRFKDGLDSLLGLGATDVRRRHDGVYDIELNHVFLQRLGRC